MILTKVAEVKISEANFSYFDNLGYEVTLGEKITIPIDLLSKGSHFKILCKCDKCGIQKKVLYKNYVKYDNPWGEYYCRKCSESKRKKTLRKNYGVDYPVQNEILKGKILRTINNKQKK